jgi:hypothetical protein
MKLQAGIASGLLVASACSGQAGPDRSAAISQASTSNPYVFVVMMENTNASQIYGVPLLRGAAGAATNDFADLFVSGFFP